VALQRIPSTEGSRRTGTLRTNSSDKCSTYLGSQGLVTLLLSHGHLVMGIGPHVRPVVVHGRLAQAATVVSYH